MAMSDLNLKNRPTRRFWALLLWVIHVLAILGAMAGVGGLDVESILVTGPLLVATGLALAIVTRPVGSLTALLFGLSAPAVCAIVAFAIAALRWDPPEAERPVLVIAQLYMILSVLPAIIVLIQIWRWQTPSFPRLPRVWRFSMKMLLAVMTGVAISLGLLTTIAKVLNDVRPVFTLFGFIVITLTAVVARGFFLERRRLIEPSSTARMSQSRWLDRISNFGIPTRKRNPTCSFCGRSFREAGPFAEGRDGSLICFQCSGTCMQLLSKMSAEVSTFRDCDPNAESTRPAPHPHRT
jgi:hypothetical protein